MTLKQNLTELLVPTLNNMGYMFNPSTPYGEAFLKFSAVSGGPVLDVGTAYGTSTLQVLNNGIKVVANDLEPKHLDILMERVPENLKPLLTLSPGKFPTDVSYKPNSFKAILLSNILHFLKGEEIEMAAQKTFEWLQPGGKVFIIAASPYVGMFQDFTSQFEKNRKNNVKWPGYVPDLKIFKNNTRLGQLPGFMHFFHPEDLKAVFEKAGFEIETAEYFPQPMWPEDMRLDGRESVGLIVRKALY
jgi:predicted SAM-dependent methyltransferase